jgi:hypothetical protein
VTDAAVTMDFHPQPAPGPSKPWAFPVPERGALASGLTVLRCHRPGQQVAAVEICLDMPLDAEPDGLDGIAAIMMSALAEGTSQHTAEEFAAEMERCGATLDASADYPGARVSLEVPVSRLPRALGLLAEALHTPTFPDSEIWRRSCSPQLRGCPGRAGAPKTPSHGSARRACARSTRLTCGPRRRPRSSWAT